MEIPYRRESIFTNAETIPWLNHQVIDINIQSSPAPCIFKKIWSIALCIKLTSPLSILESILLRRSEGFVGTYICIMIVSCLCIYTDMFSVFLFFFKKYFHFGIGFKFVYIYVYVFLSYHFILTTLILNYIKAMGIYQSRCISSRSQ